MNLKNLLKICADMKELKRQGWIYRDIPHPENDAAHSWSVSFLVQMFAPQELDLCKCLKMANIHDLAETIIGDFTPIDPISPEEKHTREVMAMQQIVAELPPENDVLALFQEYEAMVTPEALFVKGIDKLDAVMQAKFYDQKFHKKGKLFEEFYDYALTQVQHPVVLDLLKQLKEFS